MVYLWFYNRNYQYVQRISRPIPDDPVNLAAQQPVIKPQYSNHWSLEYKAEHWQGAYEYHWYLLQSMGNQPGFRSVRRWIPACRPGVSARFQEDRG